MKRWYTHVEACRECTPFRPCAAGAIILERACNETAARMAPAPIEVIDFDAHQRSCTDCTSVICAKGRALLDAAARAIDNGAPIEVKRMGKA